MPDEARDRATRIVPSGAPARPPRLPHGSHLSDDVFGTRLNVVLVGLFVSVAVVGVIGMLSYESPGHVLAELFPAFGCLVVGRWSRDRVISTGAVAVGLALTAAMLVHFTDGLIESHFAFFVLLPLIALLHDWRALLGSTLFVFAHHAVVGTVRPEDVYNHPAALENPIPWGAIHIAFVLALGLVLFVHWRYSEAEQQATKRALAEVTASRSELESAGERFRSLVQNAFDAIVLVEDDDSISYIGGAFENVFGADASAFLGRPVEALVEGSHVDDLGPFRSKCDELRRSGGVEFCEVRLARPDGSWRQVEMVGRRLSADAGDRRVVINARDTTETHLATQVLEYRATHDELTGLPNRTLLAERVDAAISCAGDDQVGLLFLDVDRFKNINDSMGHEVGDRLLIAIARRLELAVPPDSTVSRLGGDEFVVLVGGASTFESLVELGECVGRHFDDPIILEGHRLNVSVSSGVALADSGDSARALLRNADLAMYQAKQAGRGRVSVFDEAARVRNERRLAIESELRAADFDAEMVLQYQPIIDMAGGSVIGAETLIRWHHPTRGLLMPGEFIEVAEESGLILGLGEWVLGTACRQGAAWHSAYGLDIHIAVNVSARQLGQPGFGQIVADAVEESGIDPKLLLVEVTESALVDDQVMARANLADVRALGVDVALDDYGTGYASLTYLRSLPLTHIKIDRSFVDGLDSSREAAAIVENTVSLARGLGMIVVAEGIETAAQYDALRGFGCDLAQGYHLGRPMDPIDIEAHALARAPRTDDRGAVVSQGLAAGS